MVMSLSLLLLLVIALQQALLLVKISPAILVLVALCPIYSAKTASISGRFIIAEIVQSARQ